MWAAAVVQSGFALRARHLSNSTKAPKTLKHKPRVTNSSTKTATLSPVVDPRTIQRSVMAALVNSTLQASPARKLFADAAKASEQQENASLLDESTLESLSDSIDENMSEGMEVLVDTVVAPLIPPLSDELADVVKSNSPTMQDYFAKLCEDTIPTVSIDSIAPTVTESLGASVTSEQLKAALDSIQQNGGSSIVAMAVAADFWKTSLDPVIEKMSKDFAKHASQIVADHALEIFQKRMQSDLTKMVHSKIDDIQAGNSSTKPSTDIPAKTDKAGPSSPKKAPSKKAAHQKPLHPL